VSNKFDESYYGSGKHIKYAVNKYGKDNFKREILEWCNSKDSLINREVYWIQQYDAMDASVGYNILPGGEGGYTMCGKHHTDEVKLKIGNIHRGEKHTEEHNQKIRESVSKALKGKKHSDEWKKHSSEALKGRKAWNKGLKMSDEFCEKNRKSHIGQKNTEQQNKIMSNLFSGVNNPFYGCHHTDETKQKISEKCIGRVPYNKGKKSAETSERMCNNSITKNRVWITKDDIHKLVNKTDIDYFMSDGFHVGRK
jgi:group I intron endonuclease